jgi:hypothetical protein
MRTGRGVNPNRQMRFGGLGIRNCHSVHSKKCKGNEPVRKQSLASQESRSFFRRDLDCIERMPLTKKFFPSGAAFFLNEIR